MIKRYILKILKTAKPVQDNLNRKQRIALKEIKDDENISNYWQGYLVNKSIDEINKYLPKYKYRQ